MMDRKYKLLGVCEWLSKNNLVDDFHNFIQRDDCFRRLASGLCGWSWEDEFKATCLSKDLFWEPAKSKVLPYDGQVNGKKVQCKFECVDCVDNPHALDIRCKRVASENEDRLTRRYLKSDFDVLAVKIMTSSKSKIFLIPSKELIDTRDNLKARIKLQDYSDFVDNWTEFNHVVYARV